MPKKHCLIYIPGIGDHRIGPQKTIIRSWQVFGVRTYVYPVGWADGKPFGPKLDKLLVQIDRLAAAGGLVSLVGVSAGAGAALNAYARRRQTVNGVVCICGKVQNRQNINPGYFKRNPSFKDSMDMLPASLSNLNATDRARILSIHPIFDELVPVRDTKIAGARSKTVPVAGHIIGIAYTLTIGSRAVVNFLKNLPPPVR